MRLALVGSRSISTEEHIEVYRLIQIYFMLSIDILISGGADGVDTMSENYALMVGVPTKIFYPLGLGWPCYKARNILIAEDCTHLVCIQTRSARTNGSGWTADYAESIGRTVWRELC